MKGLFSLVPVARSREVDLAPRGPPCLLPRSAPGQLPVSGATFQAGKRVGLRGKASATPGPALGRGGACLETAGAGKSVGILRRLAFPEFWHLRTPEWAASPWGASTWRPRPSVPAPGVGHLTPGKLPSSAPFHLLIRTAGKSLGDGNGPCSPAPISFLLTSWPP